MDEIYFDLYNASEASIQIDISPRLFWYDWTNFNYFILNYIDISMANRNLFLIVPCMIHTIT